MFAPLSGRELWCRLPWVDRASCNISLTRIAASFAMWKWAGLVEKYGWNWPAALSLGIIAVMLFSKNVSDIEGGLRALGSVFRRRSSDRMQAVPESREREIL